MKSLLSLALVLGVCAALPAAEQGKEVERLQKSAEVIDEVMKTPEKGVPKDLLDHSVCVGVIPSQKKVALGLGGSYGRGCLVCRRGGNGLWGAPWMFAIGGPSIGFQIGGQATDFVLLVMNAKGAQTLVKGKTKLGADASVAGGPVGRTAEGATGVLMQTEILTYSRSRGAFAGLSLEGQVIKDDGTANENLYGRKIVAKDILFGSTGVPAAGRALDAVLTKASPRGGEAFKK
ncbi:MAG: lipid-binding SYLF domain-containing protein [Acidobacteriia bacterium]|nr:lipid-binding SYLF domain-containing protein [Terriglobia bacterium]